MMALRNKIDFVKDYTKKVLLTKGYKSISRKTFLFQLIWISFSHMGCTTLVSKNPYTFERYLEKRQELIDQLYTELEQVKDVLYKRNDYFNKCFPKDTGKFPDVEQFSLISFTISKSGKILIERIHPPAIAKDGLEFERCLRVKLNRLDFIKEPIVCGKERVFAVIRPSFSKTKTVEFTISDQEIKVPVDEVAITFLRKVYKLRKWQHETQGFIYSRKYTKQIGEEYLLLTSASRNTNQFHLDAKKFEPTITNAELKSLWIFDNVL